MSETKIYGTLNSERLANESTKARQIVSVINEFGVSNRERWLIIKNLALEVEEFDKMRELIGWLHENVPNVFIAQEGEENG